MAAVIPINKTRSAISALVLRSSGTILKRREIVDIAGEVAKGCQGVERGRAGTLESYTRKTMNRRWIESHYPQSPTTSRTVLGLHPTREKKIGELQSGSKPTKLGRRNTFDDKNTYKVDHLVAEVAAYVPQSSQIMTNNKLEKIVTR